MVYFAPAPLLNMARLHFDDGNIIVRTESADLKGHRGMLGQLSPSLAALFSHHPLCLSVVEEPPVIELEGCGGMIEVFLQAAYGGAL